MTEIHFIFVSLSSLILVSFICIRLAPTVLSTSLGKTFFAWRFVLNENILFLFNVSYQTPFMLLCFCDLFSNIYTKIKVTAKSWSDLCGFYSKVIFLNFCIRKYFYCSLLNLNH